MKYNNQSKLITYLVLLGAFLTFILNYFLRWPLYEKGLNIIYHLQSLQSVFLDWFFLIITMIIDPSIVLLITVIIMGLSRRKGRAFTFLVFILLNTYLAGVLKAADCDPRPFWTNSKIKNIGFYCPVQYGNPSGHSWFSTVLGFGFILDFYGVGKNYKNLIIALSLFIFVPMSRMYLGAHSLNQVLYGLVLGCSMNILYIFQFKQKINEFLNTFNEQVIWKIVIFVLHIGYLIPYFFNLGDELPDIWVQNIDKKCGKGVDEENLNFLMLMINSLLVSIATGLGIGFSSIVKENRGMGKSYLRGSWQINQQKYEWKMGYFLYILIEIGCLLSGLVAGIAVASIMPTKLIVFVSVNVGATFSGYIYTKKTLQFLNNYKVIKQIVQE